MFHITVVKVGLLEFDVDLWVRSSFDLEFIIVLLSKLHFEFKIDFDESLNFEGGSNNANC